MDGVLLMGRREIECTEREMLIMATIEPLLRKLGLSLYCERCHAGGLQDGVKAENHPGDHTWTIECGCSVRTWRRHVPNPTVQ